jgi:hypothetical protein
MAKVRLELRAESLAEAVSMADDIRNHGTINYIDAEGAETTVVVGDVTAEDGS